MRKDALGKGRRVNMEARRKAMSSQWDAAVGAFRCFYTGVPLTENYGSRRYATWEHREPGDESTVVLVADLVNKMKSDLKEDEFRAMVHALSRYFDRQLFDESAFPLDKQQETSSQEDLAVASASRAGGEEHSPASREDPSGQASEADFHGAMVEVYERARDEAGYLATRYIQMVSEHGGLEAARRLLRAPTVSDGFTALWERGRLDLAVEALVPKAQFSHLFTPEEVRIARERLERYGFQGVETGQ
jgi:hypothetical protein